MNKDNIEYEILTNDVFKGENNKYYYFYKIVNKLNNMYYYGVHETTNINDKYCGSGRELRKAQQNEGILNFKKYILKFFNNHTELYKYEKEIVTKEVAIDNMSYNRHRGGDGSWDFTLGYVCVKDKNNNMFLVKKDDPRYISGELVSNMKGLIHVTDINGNKLTVSVDEYRNNKDKYKMIFNGTVSIIDENGIKKHIPKCEYDKLKETKNIHGVTKGKGVFIDNNGNGIMCDINDERVLSGELKGYTSQYTVYKFKDDFNKTCFTTKDDPRVKSGELVGINYGIIYCRDVKTGEKIKTTKDDPRLKTGEIISSMKYLKVNKNFNFKTKQHYIEKYPEIINLLNLNVDLIEISKKTGYSYKKIKHIKERYESFK
ncbi:MAG: hypothetical protein IJH39_09275 [Clostridia bacterium]|nr:hypothetical protein [Clostridia bacterium]